VSGVLFTNGRIYTLDHTSPLVEALAVRDGRIVAAGRTDEVREAFSSFRRVDLGGRTVVPGFVDSHIHLPSYGIGLRRVDLHAARTLHDAVALVAAAVKGERAGAWVRGRGWDKNVWPEGRFPTKEDLDPVSPDHPVALSSKDGHLLWVNSAALHLAGIDRRTPDPPGGEIARGARGEPTGIFKEEATRLIWRAVPRDDAELVERGIIDATAVLHRWGIVGVHNFVGADADDGSAALAAFRRLRARGVLKLRVWAALPLTVLDAAPDPPMRTGSGDAWLRIGPVKVFADGTLGSQTASMLEPFDGPPGNVGIAIHDREALGAIVRRAVEGGYWCAIHAIGDRANRAALDAYQATLGASRRAGARHRIEHVQLLHPDDLPRLARLGVIASMQPVHATSDRDMAERYWGTRSRFAYAWRALRDCGTLLAFGSDAPVETPDVFAGLYAAVTRRRAGEPDGASWHPEQALTVADALRAYTVGPAFASGEEAARGTLGVGRLADFAVIDRDLLQVAPEEILHARVDATAIGGELVYTGPGFSG